jgi:carboxyl-terminal processing protease
MPEKLLRSDSRKRIISIGIIAVITVLVIMIILKINTILVSRGHTQDRVKNEDKFREIVDYISSYYVDEVDWTGAYQSATESILSKLDPHSIYISASEAEVNEENFEGRYQGIGIQFDIIDEYITVITAIRESPADKVGLMAGDRIIKIDGNSAIGIAQSKVPRLLKGKSGTSVQITVLREGVKDPLEFTITRDEIPIYTVTDYFMRPDSIGYISLSSFAKTTEQEFDQALTALENQGMRGLILDLRWNAGGLLDQAVKVASRFLSGHKKVVFTRGRLREFDEEYYSDTFGHRKVRDYPLMVLINYGSASAAEIVAGAVQDYDRGLIIGTNSFGKGLVQREFPLQDNSRLRLTISKYYTPSGRLIQKPYKGKDAEQYYAGLADSLPPPAVRVDSTDTLSSRIVYYTTGGRKVYGGGGINPDSIIKPSDHVYSPELIQKIREKRLIFEAASRYAQNHQELKNDLNHFLSNFKVDHKLWNDFILLAVQKGIVISSREAQINRSLLELSLKAEVARSLWGNDKYHRVLLEEDNQYQTSLILFSQAGKLMSRLENSATQLDAVH